MREGWKVEGGPEAGPQPEARFRYDDPTWKGDGMWSWRENPFDGTRELNGLIVMNVLINNWDVKASNNKTYLREGQTPRRIYVVKDLGQSFGHSVQHVPRLAEQSATTYAKAARSSGRSTATRSSSNSTRSSSTRVSGTASTWRTCCGRAAASHS